MNNTASIAALAKTFRSMVQGLDVEDYFKSFHTTPQHDGSPHIESNGDRFHFVVTERGSELERIKDLTSDEVLYLLFEGITFHMATKYELKNREDGIDGRRVWFPYQEQIMGTLNIQWGKRLNEKHRKILEHHPFQDKDAQQDAPGDAPKAARP